MSLHLSPWTPKRLAWLGALFITGIAGEAGYDVWRSHRDAVSAIEKDIAAQARLIAEQTARGLQGIDLVLRHVAEDMRQGRQSVDKPEALQAYLREQDRGLVQAAGLVVVDSMSGRQIAASRSVGGAVATATVAPGELARRDLASLRIGNVAPDRQGGERTFSIERPVVGLDVVVRGEGRVAYFQGFYGELFPDSSTRVALMLRDGRLLARHPPAEEALGRRLEVIDAILPQGGPSSATARLPSPVDGKDHFVGVQAVPDYPLAVAVSRDADAALASWRKSAAETGMRMLFLGAFAIAVLWMALRQLSRAQAAGRALAVSEERYALAMTGSDEGHWLWDIPARQMFISARLADLFEIAGGTQTMAEEDYFTAIPLHAEDRERVHRAREDHLAGRTPRLDHEFRIVRAGTGEIRWIHTRAQCFRDASGLAIQMAGATVDVSVRKRAELALRESEERYALAMTGSSGGHWVWDVAHDQVFVSASVRQVLGMPLNEPTASRADFLARVPFHPEDRDQVLRSVEEQLRSGAARIEYEARVILPDGAIRWVLSRARRFETPAEGIRIAGVSVDITDRKAAEQEREALEQRLLQAQKLEAIGTLAGGIAHDFNNILAAIRGYGELAQGHAPEGTPLRRHIDASMAAAAKAKSLVERILAFSRSGLGERVLVHAGAAVRDALDSVAGAIPSSVQLASTLDAGAAAVRADRTQVHQIVINLCMNAVQALPAAGGTVTVVLTRCGFPAPLPVTTGTLPAGDYLKLEVADSGEGIAAGVLSRIFDPFFTTREIGVGTGLGLSLVHGIASDLAGGIHVDSRPGQGTRMQVYLPVAADGVPEPAAEDEELVEGHGEVILVVDDEEVLVRLAEEALAELGYEPVGFTSATAALEALRAEPMRFDLLLTDEAMPAMTGLMLAREARALRDDLPVLVMSGFVTPQMLQSAEAQGVTGVLAKPLTGREIARLLAKALNPRLQAAAD